MRCRPTFRQSAPSTTTLVRFEQHVLEEKASLKLRLVPLNVSGCSRYGIAARSVRGRAMKVGGRAPAKHPGECTGPLAGQTTKRS
jgi:hypothetical protein